MTKICYIDTETTGLDAQRHGIIQLAAIMEINGEAVGQFEIKICPHNSCEISAEALEISKTTLAEIQDYTVEVHALSQFRSWLGQYVSKFDRLDKAFFCGYNAGFDERFVRALFERQGDQFYGSWFWAGTIDVMGFALYNLRHKRPTLPNFQLGTVAKFVLGSRVEELTSEFGLHNALTDIRITRELFEKVKPC
jgi:DNA polymerase-3 subunit epsilon